MIVHTVGRSGCSEYYYKIKYIRKNESQLKHCVTLQKIMSDEDVYVSSDGSASDEDSNDTNRLGTTRAEAAKQTVLDSRIIHELVLTDEQVNASTGGSLHMTKYEYTRIKGERLQQLNSGSIPFVPYIIGDTIEKIFRREFTTGKIPFLIERKTPDGKNVLIKIRQFTNRNSDNFD